MTYVKIKVYLQSQKHHELLKITQTPENIGDLYFIHCSEIGDYKRKRRGGINFYVC